VDQANILHNVLPVFLSQGAMFRNASGQIEWFCGPWKQNDQGDEKGPSVELHSFFSSSDPTPTFRPSFAGVISIPELNQLLSDPETLAHEGFLKKLAWEEPSFESFTKDFQEIKSKINAGEVIKAVPIATSGAKQSMGSHQIANLIKEALKAPKEFFVYGFWDQTQEKGRSISQGIIGASPEILFVRSNKKLYSMALAGTFPKTRSAQELYFDEKESFEHQVVVEDLFKELSDLGSVKSSGKHVLELPTLNHLRTMFEVELDAEFSHQELIKKLHPTPALGWSPRTAKMDWFQNLHGNNKRQWFGAPFVWRRTSINATAIVAIRNLIWKDEKIELTSGCGIVAQSELENEWAELKRKRDSVLKIFGGL